MPALRLCARRRLPFCAAVVCVALLVLAFQPAAVTCPMMQPQTLRTLYEQSDLIVVAQLADSVQLGAHSSGGSTRLRTRLLVSETWKGTADEKGVSLLHWMWNMGGEIPRAAAAGEHLLLFLARREEGDGYELLYPTYGVKIVSSADLKVYRRRVEELAVIMRQNPPDKADLVEWVVRCAEDHATRWDAAYELMNSQYAERSFTANRNTAAASVEAANVEAASVEATTQAAAGASPAPESSATAVAGETVLVNGVYVSPSDAEIMALPLAPDTGINFQARLTFEQKQRLLESLYNSQRITQSEMMMLEVVKDWKDERLVPFLLSHLQRIKDNPDYYAEQMVSLVAQKLNDSELLQLASTYSSMARYVENSKDEEVIEDETGEVVESVADDEEQASDDAESESETETNEQAATEEKQPAVQEEKEPAVQEAKDDRTERQKRSARLQEFIALVELKMMQQLAMKY